MTGQNGRLGRRRRKPVLRPHCFTLDELMKGGSNEIHSIALHKIMLNQCVNLAGIGFILLSSQLCIYALYVDEFIRSIIYC